MNALLEKVKLIEKWSKTMDGVLTTGDLKRLFNEDNDLKLFRRIRTLESNNILRKFIRGYYITNEFSLEALSARIYPDSCITCTTVLAKALAIGSVPARTVYAVKAGRNRSFTTPFGNIYYWGIAPHLLFGCYHDKGVQYASPEKALLDMLYFYQKGRKFSIDIYSDVNISMLNTGKVRQFLRNYRNPRFISFVEGYLDDRIK